MTFEQYLNCEDQRYSLAQARARETELRVERCLLSGVI